MKYKIVKRAEPGIPGGGNIKYYPASAYSGELDLPQLGKMLSQRSTVTKVDAIAVIIGLVDIISEELAAGKVIRLGELGSFRLSLSGEGADKEEEISHANITKSKILYRPDTALQKSLGKLKLEKAKTI